MPGPRLQAHQLEYVEFDPVPFGEAAASVYIGPLVLTATIDNDHHARDLGAAPGYGDLYIGTDVPYVDASRRFCIPGAIPLDRLSSQDEITIGRSNLEYAFATHDQPISVEDRRKFEEGLRKVSRTHARLNFHRTYRMSSVRGNTMGVEDLGSTNGTFRVH